LGDAERLQNNTHITLTLNLYLNNSKMRQNIEENGRDDWILTSDPLTLSQPQILFGLSALVSRYESNEPS
jgi:hypothetical protein